MPSIQRKARRSLSSRIRIGFFVAAGIAALLLVGQLVYSGGQADRFSEDRQSSTAQREIDKLFDGVMHDQLTVTIWDDAVANTQAFDYRWVEENIGKWMQEAYGIDRIYVVDGQDRMLYAYSEGATGTSDAVLPTPIAMLMVEMREALKTAETPSKVQVSDIVVVDGQAAFVSIAPIMPYSERMPVPQHPAAQILVENLGSAFERVGDANRFVGGHFTELATEDGHMVLPIRAKDGALVGGFAWEPYRPGEAIISASTPLLMVAIATIVGLVAYLGRDIGRMSAELQESEAEAYRQARKDPLTGLPNRLQFSERMEERLTGKVPTAAIYVDIDNFKGVNDSLGHPAGDELIRIIGGRLVERMATIGFVARIGGDEFAVLVDEAIANGVAETIVSCIRQPATVQGIDLPITASVGVACCTGESYLGSAELLRRADIALYQAKLSGRDCHRLFEASMDDDAHRKRLIERDLRTAMAAGDQLRLAFQPLYSGEGSIDGVETLVRWNHPTFGELPPPIFIQVAEESGLIMQLGDWILEHACRHAVGWGIGYVAVNVSAVQFRAPNFVQSVVAILERTGLPAERLELELTENVIADQTVTEAVRVLRAMGIRIALDDFGTGFSSLNYLRQFPVDKIKVDRSFVQQATTDKGVKAIVVAMVRLAKAFDLQITAEGVETEEQRRMLVGLGCHQLQGYLMSRPVPPETITSMLGKDVREAA